LGNRASDSESCFIPQSHWTKPTTRRGCHGLQIHERDSENLRLRAAQFGRFVPDGELIGIVRDIQNPEPFACPAADPSVCSRSQTS
jgi:hypothetical protein